MLKALISLTCVAVLAAIAYYFWGEFQGDEAARQRKIAAAQTIIESLGSVAAAEQGMDPALKVCRERAKQQLLYPGSFELLSHEVGGTVVSMSYSATGLENGLDIATCVFVRGPDGRLYLHDDPVATEEQCSEQLRAVSPECVGTTWAAASIYPINPQATALSIP